MTIGEKRVRVEFNPSQNDLVSQIKQKTAELMNIMIQIQKERVPANNDGEQWDKYSESCRLCDIALIKYEESCMFAVKALTT